MITGGWGGANLKNHPARPSPTSTGFECLEKIESQQHHEMLHFSDIPSHYGEENNEEKSPSSELDQSDKEYEECKVTGGQGMLDSMAFEESHNSLYLKRGETLQIIDTFECVDAFIND